MVAKWLGIGTEISKPIDSITNGIDKLFTSDDEKLSRAEMMERLKLKGDELTNQLDKIYANSTNPIAKLARPLCVHTAWINFMQLGVGVMWFDKMPPEWYVQSSTTGFLGALGLYGIARTVEKMKR